MSRKPKDRPDVALDGPARQAARGELHDESGGVMKGGVLPAGDAPWEHSETAKRQADQPGVTTFDPRVAARSVYQPGVLVVPDAYRGPELPDEGHDRS